MYGTDDEKVTGNRNGSGKASKEIKISITPDGTEEDKGKSVSASKSETPRVREKSNNVDTASIGRIAGMSKQRRGNLSVVL